MGTTLGNNMTCLRKHENAEAIQAGSARLGMGRDLDDAVLAASNRQMNANAQGLVNMVNLSFAGSNFPNLDTYTYTDGMVVLYQKQGQMWNKIGTTEIVWDNLNPKWVKSFDVPYHFERREYYKVVVYDIEDRNRLDNLAVHDLVGELQFALHEVVTARDQTLIKDLDCSERAPGKSGKIHITGDEKQVLNNEEANFKISAQFEDTSGYNFFFVHKNIAGQTWKPVYKSEIQTAISGTFSWNLISILTGDLCNEEPEREIRLEFFKSSKTGKHRNLGFITCNMAQLKEGSYNYMTQGKIKNQQVSFSNVYFHKRHSFLEYVFGGCEIQLVTAIDFTLSNGNPAEKDSLHYLDMNKNEYLQAIKSVGNILQYYDSDKQLPVYGFGATVPPETNKASHCFALNGDIFDPEVDGLDGVLEAYKNALQNVNLYGPTNFAPIVELVNDMAEQENVTQDNQKYYILLIITDGIINDMQKTIDQIVRGSTLPLSVIIVGVGNDDFESMDILDADDIPLYSTKYKKNMESDIVQFVPFREFRNNPTQLAKETLEEVPRQLLDFMRKNNIAPMPANDQKRRQVQQKLAMQRATAAPGSQGDDFFSKRGEEFIAKMTQMGMDYAQVKDFIDNKGLYEENPELILDHLNNPHYQNVLKSGFIQAPNPHNLGYNYVDQSSQAYNKLPLKQNFTPMGQQLPPYMGSKTPLKASQQLLTNPHYKMAQPQDRVY